MSDIQQPEEKKAPTTKHVLGASALMAVIFSVLLSVVLVMVDWWVDAKVLFNCLPVFFIPALIGAFVGVSMPKSIDGKWSGLWIGAAIGPLLICSFWMVMPKT